MDFLCTVVIALPLSTIVQEKRNDDKSTHHNDVILTTIASQITRLMVVYPTVYSDADKRKHQSSASLAFVRGIHRRPVNSPHKWPVTRKKVPFDDVIMPNVIKIITGAPPPHVSYFTNCLCSEFITRRLRMGNTLLVHPISYRCLIICFLLITSGLVLIRIV